MYYIYRYVYIYVYLYCSLKKKKMLASATLRGVASIRTLARTRVGVSGGRVRWGTTTNPGCLENEPGIRGFPKENESLDGFYRVLPSFPGNERV